MGYRIHLDKPDALTSDIKATLEAVGVSAWYIGRPLDLLTAFRGVFRVIEVKTPGEKLSDKQSEDVEIMKYKDCPVHVIESVAEALRVHGVIRS